MESLKEIKQLIITDQTEKGMDNDVAKEWLKTQYEELAETNPIFKMNKQIAYGIIAKKLKIKLTSLGASSSKKAFPLQIGEILNSEHDVFDLSGYVVRPPFFYETEAGNDMFFLEIADKTGIVTFSGNSAMVDISPISDLELVTGDFVSAHNLKWKDKTKYSPSYGKFSSVEKSETDYELNEIKCKPIASVVYIPNPPTKSANYHTIKGIVAYLPEENKMTAYHCSGGHWFKGMKDENVGELAMCEGDKKCGEVMEVLKHISVQDVIFADETEQINCNFSPFAELDDINAMETYILTGKIDDDGIFNITDATLLTKKN